MSLPCLPRMCTSLTLTLFSVEVAGKVDAVQNYAIDIRDDGLPFLRSYETASGLVTIDAVEPREPTRMAGGFFDSLPWSKRRNRRQWMSPENHMAGSTGIRPDIKLRLVRGHVCVRSVSYDEDEERWSYDSEH